MKKILLLAIGNILMLSNVYAGTGIETGAIWNNLDAQKKCPNVCSVKKMKWNGNWVTKVPGKTSICNCDVIQPEQKLQSNMLHGTPSPSSDLKHLDGPLVPGPVNPQTQKNPASHAPAQPQVPNNATNSPQLSNPQQTQNQSRQLNNMPTQPLENKNQKLHSNLLYGTPNPSSDLKHLDGPL